MVGIATGGGAETGAGQFGWLLCAMAAPHRTLDATQDGSKVLITRYCLSFHQRSEIAEMRARDCCE